MLLAQGSTFSMNHHNPGMGLVVTTVHIEQHHILKSNYINQVIKRNIDEVCVYYVDVLLCAIDINLIGALDHGVF